MADWPGVETWLEALRRSRPVFHSEADFQHALAWAIQVSDPLARVRLETRPAPGVRLDLLISRPDLDRHLVLELKYLTAAWAGEVNAERFELLSQGAQDIRAYDVVKDIQRVERFVGGQPGWSGVVLVLANDPAYWSRPSHGRRTNADAFRIYEGQVITGSRIWGAATGAGTMKGREAALELHGNYRCRWSGYSALPGNRGQFRLLTITIGGRRPDPAEWPLLAGEVALSPLLPPYSAGHPAEYLPPSPSEPASDAAAGATAPSPGEAPGDQRYSIGDLQAELRRFEQQLRAASLKENSVATYVDRTGRFLKWLNGDYRPRGPN
jgi:hypothetical protein